MAFLGVLAGRISMPSVNLRALTVALGAVCWLFSSNVAVARPAPYASIVEAALAGAELCSRVYLNGMSPTHIRLSDLYDEEGWRVVDRFPEPEIGDFFGPEIIGRAYGEAELAPGVAGRVVSVLGRGAG